MCAIEKHTTDPREGIDPRLRVVMSGPLPPVIGGMATVIEDISRSSLAQQVDLVLFNTAKKTQNKQSLWGAFVSKLRLWRRWWSIVGGSGPSVAHIHTCSGLSFFLDGVLLVLARLRGTPGVLHVHGAQFDQFLDQLPSFLLSMARWIARRAGRVIVLSDEWQEKLAPRLPGAQLAIVPNGVPVPPTVDRQGQQESKVIILFLGNLSQRKGVWDLLQAMQSVPESARLVLAGGEDDPGIGDKFKREISRLGLASQVQWLGPVYGEDKSAWLNRADIFVLPSYAEGLPISLLEAMCGGLAVVTTPVGGIPSVVTDNKQGLLVPPGEIQALADALGRLIGDEELRIRLGDAARRRCSDTFGIERAAQGYLDVYRELVIS